MALAGAAAGAVSGLFGAGGGMVLVPLLTLLAKLPEDRVFPTSVSVILPVCLVCLSLIPGDQGLPWGTALPYLMGSCAGGVLAGLLGQKLPTVWLHRLLGVLILWGGIRYLW
ncbi:MAG: sulfite exporter TauE/SafE family protein [Oscillospiraceae bacterium]|nr:sulfite exporter TauE/SafE family protein [Oscillospiraceae bacterium]